METFEQRLESVGALADDLRRAMYLFIRAQRRPVGRDEAAQAVGISRKLAAFHLDKLVEKGLLTAHYMRLSGRRGPGAGRPAKVYEPSGKQISVSIPFRSYDVVGDVLLDALESPAGPKPGQSTTGAAAYRRGVEIGQEVRRASGKRPRGQKTILSVAFQALAARGYEPYSDGRGGLRLHNCPFHDLSRRSPELVCGINQAFIEGVLSGLGDSSFEAVLDPQPGECCVQLRPKEAVA